MSAAAVIIVINIPPRRKNASLADQVAESVRAAMAALEASDEEPLQNSDPAVPGDQQ